MFAHLICFKDRFFKDISAWSAPGRRLHVLSHKKEKEKKRTAIPKQVKFLDHSYLI